MDYILSQNILSKFNFQSYVLFLTITIIQFLLTTPIHVCNTKNMSSITYSIEDLLLFPLELPQYLEIDHLINEKIR